MSYNSKYTIESRNICRKIEYLRKRKRDLRNRWINCDINEIALKNRLKEMGIYYNEKVGKCRK